MIRIRVGCRVGLRAPWKSNVEGVGNGYNR